MDPSKRPRSVTFLIWGVLIIALFFWVRAFQAIRMRDFIEMLNPSVSPAYLVITGITFGLAGLRAIWGLWFGKPWGGRFAQRFFVALAVYYWLDYALLVVSEIARSNWVFALTITLLVLVWVSWTVQAAKNKGYFQQLTD